MNRPEIRMSGIIIFIYPRFENDNLYMTKGSFTMPDERSFYADKLKSWFNSNIEIVGVEND